MKGALIALALLPVSLAAHDKTDTPQPKFVSLADNEKSETPRPKIAPKVLTALNAAAAFSDTGYTASKVHLRDFEEYDPLARPIVHHTPLSLAVAGGEVVGLHWLAGRMRHSERWHYVWWLPQGIAIAAHGYALGTSVRNFSNTGNPLKSQFAFGLHYSPTIRGTK